MNDCFTASVYASGERPKKERGAESSKGTPPSRFIFSGRRGPIRRGEIGDSRVLAENGFGSTVTSRRRERTVYRRSLKNQRRRTNARPVGSVLSASCISGSSSRQSFSYAVL